MNARRFQYTCGGVISLDGIRFVSFMVQPFCCHALLSCPGGPAAAGASPVPRYFLAFASPVILSPLILSPLIFPPGMLSPLMLPPDMLPPDMLSPLMLPPLALSPLILSLFAVDGPQPAMASAKPRQKTTPTMPSQTLRMFKLPCCSEGEDRLAVVLAPDLGGPSSEADFTNSSGLLDDGGDGRLQGNGEKKRAARAGCCAELKRR